MVANSRSTKSLGYAQDDDATLGLPGSNAVSELAPAGRGDEEDARARSPRLPPAGRIHGPPNGPGTITRL
jgi:hypothetical protein